MPQIVLMSFKSFYLNKNVYKFSRVIVENTNFKVIGPSNNPLFTRNEFCTTAGRLRYFDTFHSSLSLRKIQKEKNELKIF